MHLIKSIVSGLLVFTSICWIGIQHVFLTPESFSRIIADSIKPFYNNNNNNNNIVIVNNNRKGHFTKNSEHDDVDVLLQLQRDWCRVKSKQIAWREILGTCQNNGDLTIKDKR